MGCVASEVLVLEKSPLIREGLSSLCRKNPKFKFLFVAEINQALPSGQLVLVNFEQLEPIQFVEFLEEHKTVLDQVIFYTATDSDQLRALAKQAVNYGCRFVMVEASIGRLQEGFVAATNGGTLISSHQGRPSFEFSAAELARKLSSREMEVLKQLAVGSSNREVAQQLGISVRTVETHRMRIKDKLEARSFADLVRIALEHKLVG